MLTRKGFWLALEALLTIAFGGHLLVGLPCSLWIFLSSSLHKRTAKDAVGNTSNDLVQAANRICVNTTVLLCIAVVHGVTSLPFPLFV